MQLSKVKISNLFNFPYQADFARMEGIVFSNPDKNNVNILIGPNGAGKSSFLNVVDCIWNIGLSRDYVYDKAIVSQKQNKNFKKVISLNEFVVSKSRKHFNSFDKESRVWMEFVLTHHDYENIGFIFKYRTLLNTLIAKYSTLDVQFPTIDLGAIHSQHDAISFEFVWDVDKKTITVLEQGLSQIQKFILLYFQHTELIQICIDIYNEFEREFSARKLYPLKNSFAVLGLNRSLKGVSNQVDPNIWYTYVSGKEAPEYESFVGGFLCARKIWNILNNSSEENIAHTGMIDSSTDKIQKKLSKSEFYKSLIFALNKYLNKGLLVEYKNGKLVFWLVDSDGHIFTFDDLSDGEQSLLVVIFTIYGYDLKYGTLIIDEPEIHFHPQMQKNFVRMIEKVSSNIGTQFIVSTYSPLFIDEVNIANVYKFALLNGNTSVKNPSLNLVSEESSLIHLLKFENMSKIFFANKIIMVEGETDQYFFDFYLKYLHTFPEWKSKLMDYEIININGKGGYKMWSTFLSKFGISSYFIGDWDNIIEFNVMTQTDLAYYYKQAKRFVQQGKKNKKNMSPYYNRLVHAIRALSPAKFDYIIKKIKELYKEHIFILEMGDIETYLGMREKGLQETVTFCHKNFQERLKNKEFDEHRSDFNQIFRGIFSD